MGSRSFYLVFSPADLHFVFSLILLLKYIDGYLRALAETKTNRRERERASWDPCLLLLLFYFCFSPEQLVTFNRNITTVHCVHNTFPLISYLQCLYNIRSEEEKKRNCNLHLTHPPSFFFIFLFLLSGEVAVRQGYSIDNK